MSTFDKPTREDKLGFERYVKGIEDLVRSTKPEELPIAVGIYGAWGSGKTSFMLQLKDCLENKTEDGLSSLPTVWFDAWKYDCTHDVRSALIYRILTELDNQASETAKEKITVGMKTAGRMVASLLRQSHFAIGWAGLGINMPSVEELMDQHVTSAQDFQTAVDQFETDFQQAVEAYLEQLPVEERKLVVFIDDLDRCLPNNVIVILEALKLFLHKSPCVFVIGVDRTVVEKAIQAHYGTDPGVSGRDYLDKIIQYPFTIPTPAQALVNKHFGQLLQSRRLDDRCHHILELAADGNPRIYLRLISSWNLVSALAAQVNPDLCREGSRHILMMATAVHIRFPQLHEACRKGPRGLALLAERCRSPGLGAGEQMEDRFVRAGYPEYYHLWQNRPVRQFLAGLFATDAGTTTLFDSPELLQEAFNLSARV